MTPRPYRMLRRQESADQSRLRIVKAARELLASPGDLRFSVEEVARRARVARMTVYHHFGSFQGLLEALLDSLAVGGGMNYLADAFRKKDPREALDQFISVFMGFWESDRPVLRKLGALAALDPALAAVLEERAGWRRKGSRVLLERLAKQTGRPMPKDMNDAVDLLYLLTSFSTYDTLATSKRTSRQVTKLVQRLAREALA
jgi:AcrR family transcriptional regulator